MNLKKLKKIISKLPHGYADECAAKTEADLRADIVDAEDSIRKVEAERDKDEKLLGAKEIVKDISSSYRDVVSTQRAKIAFALHTLEETGKL